MIMLNKIIKIEEEVIDIKESGSYILEFNDIKNVEIIINENIEVNIFYVDVDKSIDRNIKYVLLENAKLYVNKFYNNKEVNENIVINLDGYNSCFEYYFSGVSIGLENYKMVINHNNKNVISKIINHFVALENASCNFLIDSNVSRGNCGCEMKQETKIINLGENKSVIKPNMNIREYDVKASHGAVIGSFREEDLFYLMSRGINYNNAMNLLVRGFLILNKDDNIEFKDNINSIIDKYWR